MRRIARRNGRADPGLSNICTPRSSTAETHWAHAAWPSCALRAQMIDRTPRTPSLRNPRQRTTSSSRSSSMRSTSRRRRRAR